MRLVVAVVGKPRDNGLRLAIEEYETRAARYWPLEVHEVREEKGGSLPPAQVMSREAERLRKSIPAGARAIACHMGGERKSSEQFAEMLRKSRDLDQSLAFVIGGAHGLAEEILSTADAKLSLAPWTLPHELARLVLAEQIYRAGTISRGEPYHK